MFNKKEFLVSTQIQRYKALLPADIDCENHKSTRLWSRLEKYHGSAVSFPVQHGQSQSTIVLCSTITLGDAIQAAGTLKQELKSTLSLDLAGDLTDEYDELVSTEQAILYNAVCILRAEISQIEPPRSLPNTKQGQLTEVSCLCTPYAPNVHSLIDQHRGIRLYEH